MHVNQLGFLAALLAIQCIQQSYFCCYAKSRQASWNKKTNKISPIAFGEIRINERKKPGHPSNGTNPGIPSNGSKPGSPSNGSGGGNSTKHSKSTKSHRNQVVALIPTAGAMHTNLSTQRKFLSQNKPR